MTCNAREIFARESERRSKLGAAAAAKATSIGAQAAEADNERADAISRMRAELEAAEKARLKAKRALIDELASRERQEAIARTKREKAMVKKREAEEAQRQADEAEREVKSLHGYLCC